jgi:hypothetical protein
MSQAEQIGADKCSIDCLSLSMARGPGGKRSSTGTANFN